MIASIAAAGIGLLVGLLARPLFDAYIASRTMRATIVSDLSEDTAEAVTSP